MDMGHDKNIQLVYITIALFFSPNEVLESKPKAQFVELRFPCSEIVP